MTRRIRLLTLVAALISSAAHAQLFRAYVASYGSDANPCTVAAPCRLLPAALAAVQNRGEVWILDSANFNAGTVNIAMSVSIVAVPGQVASIVATTGQPAATIATPGVAIALRNLVVGNNATSPGTTGIVMTDGASLSIEDSLFTDFSSYAVQVVGTTAHVFVRNSVIRNSYDGISGQDGPTINVSNSYFVNSRIYGHAATGNQTTVINVSDCVISGGGIQVLIDGAGGIAKANVTRTTVNDNFFGLSCNNNAGVGSGQITVSYTTITNTQYGIRNLGCQVKSLGNNHLGDNSADVGGTGGLTPMPPY